jgi:D-alanine-D-alanine ligase-like ATP-grasp enzyme
MYPLNCKFGEEKVDDKAVTKRVLKKFGFRVIKGKVFYISHPRSDKTIKPADRPTAAPKYAQKITYPVFVKPNSGSRGSNARIIFNETGLKNHIKKMKVDRVGAFVVEKFTQRPEYRIFIVAGKVQFMYKKQRMSITGTGEHTIDELLEKSSLVPDEEFLGKLLRKEKKTKKTVLDTDHELVLQETSNVSLGAEITDYRERIPKEIHKWAHRLYETTGLEVFGVDVFAKGRWDEPSQYLIIEANSCPALSGIYNKGHKEKALKIWRIIMKRFFTK